MAVFDFLKDKRGEAAPAEHQRPANVSMTLPGADGRRLLRLPVDDIRPNPNQPARRLTTRGWRSSPIPSARWGLFSRS
jgi:hypothetical protein